VRDERRAARRAMPIAPSASQPARRAEHAAHAAAPHYGVLLGAFVGRASSEPGRQLATAGVVDHVLADQPAHHLGRREVLRGADLLEELLLARIDEQREPRGLALHAGSSSIVHHMRMSCTCKYMYNMRRRRAAWAMIRAPPRAGGTEEDAMRGRHGGRSRARLALAICTWRTAATPRGARAYKATMKQANADYNAARGALPHAGGQRALGVHRRGKGRCARPEADAAAKLTRHDARALGCAQTHRQGGLPGGQGEVRRSRGDERKDCLRKRARASRRAMTEAVKAERRRAPRRRRRPRYRAQGRRRRAPAPRYFTRMPGVRPRRARAGRCRALARRRETMPSETPNFILRGARLATMGVRRPTRSSGG
jgi:hypothetical protein